MDIVFYLEWISFMENLMKQNVVARSRAEAEYQAMTLTTCELICLKTNKWLIKELKFCEVGTETNLW